MLKIVCLGSREERKSSKIYKAEMSDKRNGIRVIDSADKIFFFCLVNKYYRYIYVCNRILLKEESCFREKNK